MKEKITITIDDLDNLKSVSIVLENLFKTILEYYIDKDDELKSFEWFILSCSVYFGKLLTLMGYDEKDFKEI
jgi:hypothetical protein